MTALPRDNTTLLYGAGNGDGGHAVLFGHDVLIKAMSGDYALHQVTLFRSVGACLFLFAWPCH